MLKYIDLKDLKIKQIETDEEIITKGSNVTLKGNSSLVELASTLEVAVKNLVNDLNPDKIYNFAFDILTTQGEELSEEEFETVVNLVVSAFFRHLKVNLGRQRERRLDVPEYIRTQVNCNLSLVKNAINYQTLVDRFQLTIYSRALQYILVGDYDE